MRAAVAEKHATPLRIVSRPRPEIGPREALVRVQASGVNPLDLKILAMTVPVVFRGSGH